MAKSFPPAGGGADQRARGPPGAAVRRPRRRRPLPRSPPSLGAPRVPSSLQDRGSRSDRDHRTAPERGLTSGAAPRREAPAAAGRGPATPPRAGVASKRGPGGRPRWQGGTHRFCGAGLWLHHRTHRVQRKLNTVFEQRDVGDDTRSKPKVGANLPCDYDSMNAVMAHAGTL